MNVVDTSQAAVPLEKDVTGNMEPVKIPEPETLGQLDLLLGRYRAVIHEPEINQSEIDALERVFLSLSEQQDSYSGNLKALRQELQNQDPYDDEVFQKQLIALQLLSRDMDIPDGLLDGTESSKADAGSTATVTGSGSEDIPPIKLSLNFDENSKSFGLYDKFSNIGVKKGGLGSSAIETTILARIAERIKELESLPANLGTYSLLDSLQFTAKDDVPSSVDDIKLKALLELKALKLASNKAEITQTEIDFQCH